MLAQADLNGREETRSGGLEILRFPLDFAGRVAVLDNGFRPEANTRQFDFADLRWIHQYSPEALVCPLSTALALADQKQRGLVDLPSLRIALVVTTRFDDSPLEEHHRDLLWRAFGVPVFEQLRAADGTVVARECEVHDGLHIVRPSMNPHIENDELVLTRLSGSGDHLVHVRTGLAAEVVNDHCECGSETPRLRHLTSLRQRMPAVSGGR